jgi:hypothetical protein
MRLDNVLSDCPPSRLDVHGSPHFCAHSVAIASGQMNRLLKRTQLPHRRQTLALATEHPLKKTTASRVVVTLFLAISALSPFRTWHAHLDTATSGLVIPTRLRSEPYRTASRNFCTNVRYESEYTAPLIQALSLNASRRGTLLHVCNHCRLKLSTIIIASMPACLPSYISLSRRHMKLGNGG